MAAEANFQIFLSPEHHLYWPLGLKAEQFLFYFLKKTHKMKEITKSGKPTKPSKAIIFK